MMMPGTTAPQPGPPKPPPRKPLPPPVGPMGLPTSGERLNVFCAKAPSADAIVNAAIRQSRAVRCARMMRSPTTMAPVSIGRSDEADDLVPLQLLHDAGELALR